MFGFDFPVIADVFSAAKQVSGAFFPLTVAILVLQGFIVLVAGRIRDYLYEHTNMSNIHYWSAVLVYTSFGLNVTSVMVYIHQTHEGVSDLILGAAAILVLPIWNSIGGIFKILTGGYHLHKGDFVTVDGYHGRYCGANVHTIWLESPRNGQVERVPNALISSSVVTNHGEFGQKLSYVHYLKPESMSGERMEQARKTMKEWFDEHDEVVTMYRLKSSDSYEFTVTFALQLTDSHDRDDYCTLINSMVVDAFHGADIIVTQEPK